MCDLNTRPTAYKARVRAVAAMRWSELGYVLVHPETAREANSEAARKWRAGYRRELP
jgi:hypothetical protein